MPTALQYTTASAGVAFKETPVNMPSSAKGANAPYANLFKRPITNSFSPSHFDDVCSSTIFAGHSHSTDFPATKTPDEAMNACF
jgi:hypothetical protein